MTTSDAQSRITAAWSTLIIFECIAGGMLMLWLTLALNRPRLFVQHPSNAIPVFLATVAVVLVFLWWRTYSIKFDDEMFRYRTLFGRTHRFRIDSVRKAKWTVAIMRDAWRPPNRLEVEYVEGGHTVRFDINMKVFRLDDCRRIESVLSTAAANNRMRDKHSH